MDIKQENQRVQNLLERIAEPLNAYTFMYGDKYGIESAVFVEVFKMVDIKLVRSNPDFVKAAVKKREMDLDTVIDEILAIDEERRALIADTEAKKAEQNKISKSIPLLKKEGVSRALPQKLSNKRTN